MLIHLISFLLIPLILHCILLIILISYFLTTKFAANLFGGSCGKFKYSHILLKNIVVIILIGLTEFVFLTYYGGAYRSIDSQQVVYILLDNLSKYKENYIKQSNKDTSEELSELYKTKLKTKLETQI